MRVEGETMSEPIKLPPDLKKDDWRHLKGYGYAPGEYTGTCHRCGETPTMDKRAITCRPCAETMHADEQKRKQEPSAWIIDGDLESLMAEGRRAVLTERNELRAEVERLRAALLSSVPTVGMGWIERAENAEAEVERLREALEAALDRIPHECEGLDYAEADCPACQVKALAKEPTK
jgi:hypothetical protein